MPISAQKSIFSSVLTDGGHYITEHNRLAQPFEQDGDDGPQQQNESQIGYERLYIHRQLICLVG